MVERETNTLDYSEPYIEGHVGLKIESGDSITIDNALGSIGFLTIDKNSKDYLSTEQLYEQVHF